jgi:hypothetical protein
MTTTADIAAALMEDLNATVFSRPFTASRAYLPIFQLGEMEDLHVTVVAAGRTVAPANRTLLQVEHRLDIAVQQRLAGGADENHCDPLLALVEEIADHLCGHTLAGAAGTTWVKTEHAPLIAAEHLHEWRQFTSIITVTYRTWEEGGP